MPVLLSLARPPSMLMAKAIADLVAARTEKRTGRPTNHQPLHPTVPGRSDEEHLEQRRTDGAPTGNEYGPERSDASASLGTEEGKPQDRSTDESVGPPHAAEVRRTLEEPAAQIDAPAVKSDEPSRSMQTEGPPSLGELQVPVKNATTSADRPIAPASTAESGDQGLADRRAEGGPSRGSLEKFDGHYHDLEELGSIPAAEPLIDEVLHRRAYHVLAGRGASFKSLVALDMSMCIATGTPWMGIPVHQGPVLYIAGEGIEGMKARARAWMAEHGITPERGAVRFRDSAVNMYDADEAFEDLLMRVAQRGYVLVVIDTLRRVSGNADENSSGMGRVIDNIARIQRATPDTAVLLIAHTTKSGESVRGFSGIVDDADILWEADRRGTESTVTLTNKKMKNGPESPELILTVKDSENSIVLVDSPEKIIVATKAHNGLSQELEYVLDQIRTEPGKPKGEYVTRNGRSAYEVVNKLEERGLVQIEPDGVRKRVRPR